MAASATQAGTVTLNLINLHGDVIGPAATTDTTWNLSASQTQTDEYGLSSTNTTSRYDYLGTHQRKRDNSRLQLMGERVYNPTTGRFLQPDPVLGGSANNYDYVNGDPVNNTDIGGQATSYGPYWNGFFTWYLLRGLLHLTSFQAAAIVGNFFVESGMNPSQYQLGGGPGRGIAQWSVNGRWQGLLWLAGIAKVSPYDITLQIFYVYDELSTTEASARRALKQATTLGSATSAFMTYYEACDPKYCNFGARLQYAQWVLSAYTTEAKRLGL
jgi:RHS repeat-associated protein